MYIVCKPIKFVANLFFLHATQIQVPATSISIDTQVNNIGEIPTLCLWLRVEEEDEQF